MRLIDDVMDNIIEVNTTTLKRDADTIRKDLKTMGKKIEELKTSADKLATMWTGPSSEAFNQEFITNLDILENVYEALLEINEFEDYSIQEYNDCESKVGDLVGQVSVG